ncbi:lysozyme [Microvirga sesbaniae]|uniref:lysozyme n=1 Tax=Microvirga sesbaniae TaxID=681392 RepID=UPI0021C6AF6B|nr:lysozyme [Microvirga sp. HBU67692]
MRWLQGLVLSLLMIASVAFAQQISFRIMSRSLIEDFGEPPLGAARSAAARPLIRLALDVIKDFEGWVDVAYDDPAGYCTIGYGHLISLKRCNEVDLAAVDAGKYSSKLSESSGLDLLEKDTVTARLAIQSLVSVDLTDEQFGALTSFVFNIGKENFKRSTMLRLLNAGEFDFAGRQFSRWIRAGEVIPPGLVARRACEETLFRHQLAYGRDGRFNRGDCVSLGAAPSAGSLIDIEKGE